MSEVCQYVVFNIFFFSNIGMCDIMIYNEFNEGGHRDPPLQYMTGGKYGRYTAFAFWYFDNFIDDF